MANNKSNYLETALVKHVLMNVPYTSPTTVYLALYTAAPGETGGGTEVSGNAYARQAVTYTESGGTATSSADVTFPLATPSGWGTITDMGIFDAVSGGNLLYYGQLTAPVVIAANDRFVFAAGQQTVQEL